MSKYAYHTFQLRCHVGFSLIGLVKVSSAFKCKKYSCNSCAKKNIKNESWRNEQILENARSEDKKEYRVCNRIPRMLNWIQEKK